MAAQAAFLMKRKGDKIMECRHPVIIGGKCVDCGAEVKNGANQPAPAHERKIAQEEPATPEKAQETPKKTTRKKAAK
jgi:hypothetical protein